jgi:phosphoribosylformylglycinamidine cyclo-ligase
MAFESGRIEGIGFDLVNHLINDVMVMGARPLYVQDCVVCGKADPGLVKRLVSGLARACAAQGAVLTGGETSVQPGVVPGGTYILTASCVGVVDRSKIIDGSRIRPGDVVLGFASNGVHTNGYSLVRRLLQEKPALKRRRVGGRSFWEALLTPHLCYYKMVRGLFGSAALKGLAHVTGGGLRDNLVRVLPPGARALIDLSKIRVLPVFKLIQREGRVPESDMLRTFNLGVGLVAVVPPAAAGRVISHVSRRGGKAYPIGVIERGDRAVVFEGALRL